MKAEFFLLSLDSKIIKYGLERTIQLLEVCGNPHLSLKSIQVIGTNGKGSMAAMLSNVLIQNNYKVGLYTSPHLVTINERIRVNNKKITNCFMNNFIKKYKKDLLIIEPSFFEIMTVMALCYFVKHQIDFAILETGLGGRLDSVTAALADTLIYTPIDIDHIAFLGDSLSSIAQEKSGAISKNCSFIFSVIQHQTVQKILNSKAKKHNKLIFYPNKKLLPYDLTGEHQTQNANFARFVLEKLITPYKLKLLHVNKYLSNTFWPGRIQFIQKNPDVVFDVAHNDHSLKAFINYFCTIADKYHHRYLVVGFEKGKQVDKSMKKLYNLFTHTVITETKIRHSMEASYIATLHREEYKSCISIELNPTKAITDSMNKMNKQDITVIIGSHYFGPYIFKLFKNSFDFQTK